MLKYNLGLFALLALLPVASFAVTLAVDNGTGATNNGARISTLTGLIL